MAQRPILILSGTNRPGSNTLKIATILRSHYDALKIPTDFYSLEELPPEIFSPSSYMSKPALFVAVQDRVLAAAGLHIVTPEYNGGFPGVLKYFIDMLKFPESFEHKPVAFTGVAAGLWGAIRPIEQLQMIFGYRNAYVYPDRVFIPQVTAKLSTDGALTATDINNRLAKQAEGFTKFAHRLA
jgi:chromate reductase, NAD(P)H dehydrogenase (quinone)